MSNREAVLAARMKFDGTAAIQEMNRTHDAFKQLKGGAAQMKQGFVEVGQGIQKLGMLGVVAAAGAGFATKKYADFADQMAAVKSVFLGQLPESQFKQLTNLAIKLGASTRFTATEAGAAMESLARSGQSAGQIMSSIRPVLAAAAAENMALASAADIVASNLAAFQLPASQAARVADTLAFVSAKTNTNMLQLQEGLKFAAATAKFARIPIEDTAAALGVLADVGLKGTLGGTALKNAIIKLSQNMKAGRVSLGKFKVEIAKNEQGGLDLAKSFSRITHTLGRIPEPMDRVKAAMKLFGIRGANAAAGFQALVENSDRLAKMGKETKLNVLFNGLQQSAKGAAEKMRSIRLNSIKGDFILLTSAIDGTVQAMGEAMAPAVRRLMGVRGVGGLTATFSQASAAFSYFANQPQKLWEKGIPAIKGVDKAIMGLVRGTLQGLDDVRVMFVSMGSGVKTAMEAIGLLSSQGSSDTARLLTKVAGITVALAAVGGAIKVVSFLFGGLGLVASGTTKIVVGGFRVMMASAALASIGLAKLGAAATWAAARTGLSGLAGTLSGPATASLGKFSAGIAIAGLAGYGLGTALDRWTGASDKLSDWMTGIYNTYAARSAERETKARIDSGRARDIVQNMILVNETAKKRGAQGTIAFRADPSQRFKVTRELAQARIEADLQKRGVDKGTQQFNQIMSELRESLSKLPTAADLKVSVQVSGREIARAVALENNEAKGRGAKGNSKRLGHVGVLPKK